MSRRGHPPVRAWLAGGIAAVLLAALCWGLGLWPVIGEAGVSPAAAEATAAQDAPAWVARLGVSGIDPWASPNPRFEEQLSLLVDTPAGAALKRDLCSGTGMQPDRRFREVRQALARNEPTLCSPLGEAVTARSPVIVALGPVAGWTLLFVTAAVGLALGGLSAWTAKRRRDRWRLVGRSTFGAPRRAGSG